MSLIWFLIDIVLLQVTLSAAVKETSVVAGNWNQPMSFRKATEALQQM